MLISKQIVELHHQLHICRKTPTRWLWGNSRQLRGQNMTTILNILKGKEIVKATHLCSGIFEKKLGYKIGGVNGDANHLLQIQLRSNKGLLLPPKIRAIFNLRHNLVNHCFMRSSYFRKKWTSQLDQDWLFCIPNSQRHPKLLLHR